MKIQPIWLFSFKMKGNAMKKTKQPPITFFPIGVIHTPYKGGIKPPPQGIYDKKSKGFIDMYPEFTEGLKDLEGFSHLIVLFHFHLSHSFDLTCYPRGDNTLRGVFATRSPRRPNPIGCSVVGLSKIDGPRLYINQVDMYNGTPLLDIKPFIPQFDEPEKVRLGWLKARFLREGLL